MNPANISPKCGGMPQVEKCLIFMPYPKCGNYRNSRLLQQSVENYETLPRAKRRQKRGIGETNGRYSVMPLPVC